MKTNLDVLDQYTLSLQGTASKMIEICLGSREFPADDVAAGALSVLGSAAHLCRWKRWGCGVHLWIRCGSIELTLLNLRCLEIVNIVHVVGFLVSLWLPSLWLPHCMGFTSKVVRVLVHLLLV